MKAKTDFGACVINYLWSEMILQFVADELAGRKFGHERHGCLLCLRVETVSVERQLKK